MLLWWIILVSYGSTPFADNFVEDIWVYVHDKLFLKLLNFFQCSQECPPPKNSDWPDGYKKYNEIYKK